MHRYYRQNTLSGQARPGKRDKKLAHEGSHKTYLREFRKATKEATQGQEKNTTTYKQRGLQRRSRKKNEGSTIGKALRIAALNVQGLNEITKTQTIERWATDNKMDVVMAQETRINDSSKEERPKHIWFFSTSTKYKDKEKLEKKKQKENEKPGQNGNKPWNTTE